MIALTMLTATTYAQTEQQNLAQIADELAGCAVTTGDSETYHSEFTRITTQFLEGDRTDIDEMTAPRFAHALETEILNPTVSYLWGMTTESYTEAFTAHPEINPKKYIAGCVERLKSLK